MVQNRSNNRMDAVDDAQHAFLAYPLGFITGIYILIRYRNSRFARFCGWQAILLSIAFTLLLIGTDLAVYQLLPLMGGVGMTSMLLASVGGVLFFILWAGMVVLSIVCMYYAFYLEAFRVPLIGNLAFALAGGERKRRDYAEDDYDDYDDYDDDYDDV